MAQLPEESLLSGIRFRLAVQVLHQVTKIRLQLLGAHTIGNKVDIEQRTQLPGFVRNYPVGLFQPVIQRCIGESSLDRDLNRAAP